jgi:hypothetical protein
MRKWLSVVLLFAFLMFPASAGAQGGGVKLKSINIELWSEYDQPSMLVIHEFTVDESVTLPVDVTVRFPKDSNLTAVATVAGSDLVYIGYQGPETQGDWQTVTVNVESYAPHRVEYYQPLIRESNKRQFVFRWFGDYPVEMFNVAMQIPADSKDVVTEPVLSSTGPAPDGLHLVGIASREKLRMGQSYEFEIEYRRAVETVTKPQNSANIQPSEPVGPDTEGRVSIDNLPYIIGGFGLALIGLALFFYWRSTQTPERKSRRRHHSANSQDEGEEQVAYCHECGTRTQKGDRFCRTCGSRIRV